jgi:acetolactate synthase-1/2/3 large subunit
VNGVTVARVLMEALLRAGTPRMFGVPGSGASDDLTAAAGNAGLPFVLTHGESAACLMAAVTGELLGVPGTALAGRDSGAASAVNGVAQAWLDRSPMILITRRPGDAAAALATHRRLEHAALFAPITKASLTIDPASASHWIAHAAQLAMKEPRGPVHVELAGDVAGRPTIPVATTVRPPAAPPPAPEILDAAARVIAGASRPVIVAGLGCRGVQAARWLRAFAEARPAPVLVTPKARGMLPDPHPLLLGVFTGIKEHAVLERADLLIAIGLDEIEVIPGAWGWKTPVLSVAPWTSTFPCVPTGGNVVGDITLVLEELAPRLRDRERADWDVAELHRLRRDAGPRLTAVAGGLAPHRVIEIARELTPPGTLATVDAGSALAAATMSWQALAPGEFLIGNRFTMGFALPAAIAARLAHPDRRVLAFTAAGGLTLAVAELETAARLALPIAVIVLDGGARPDLTALARGFGVTAFSAGSEETLRRAVLEALALDGPALIDAGASGAGAQNQV